MDINNFSFFHKTEPGSGGSGGRQLTGINQNYATAIIRITSSASCLNFPKHQHQNWEVEEKKKSKSPKYANTDDQEQQKLITLIRSLGMWKSLEHPKCKIAAKNIRDNLCSYCLVRSCVVKLNWLLNYY